ncbi:MAG: hypothetical protein QXL17_03210 [Candidatus Thermoplasmatota archaeon]
MNSKIHAQGVTQKKHLGHQGLFATVINCMDGRVQLPVIAWMQKQYQVQFVDMITEPGPIKILAEEHPQDLVHSIKNRVSISVNKHGSRILAVVGHYDCAGNPVCKELQLEQLAKARKVLSSWGFNISITTLWVDEQWKVHEIEIK